MYFLLIRVLCSFSFEGGGLPFIWGRGLTLHLREGAYPSFVMGLFLKNMSIIIFHFSLFSSSFLYLSYILLCSFTILTSLGSNEYYWHNTSYKSIWSILPFLHQVWAHLQCQQQCLKWTVAQSPNATNILFGRPKAVPN